VRARSTRWKKLEGKKNRSPSPKESRCCTAGSDWRNTGHAGGEDRRTNPCATRPPTITLPNHWGTREDAAPEKKTASRTPRDPTSRTDWWTLRWDPPTGGWQSLSSLIVLLATPRRPSAGNGGRYGQTERPLYSGEGTAPPEESMDKKR